MSRKQIVDRIVNQVSHETISLILTGSTVGSEVREESDIDFIAIVNDDAKKVEVFKKIRGLQNFQRNHIDFKIYTKEEFKRAKGGQDNFFIWSSLNKAIILHGQDIREDVKLKPRLVLDAIWKHISKVESASNMLLDEVLFSGSCVTMYIAIVTSFFIEQLILKSIKEPSYKHEYLKSHLNQGYRFILERYQWVRERAQGRISVGNFRIPSKVDSRYSSVDYRILYELSISVLSKLRRVERELSKLYE